MLVTYFYHKTTRVPGTGLTATVTLVNANRDVKLLDNAPLTELTSLGGAYVHSYSLDKDVDYIAYFSCTDPNYLPSIDKLFIPASAVASGFSVNYNSINSHTTKKINELEEKLDKIIEEKLNSLEIEMPEQEQVDLSPIIDKIDSITNTDVLKSIGIARQQLTNLSSYLRKEQEMEMKKKEQEHESKKKEQEMELEKLEEIFQLISKEYEDKIQEKEQENDGLLEEVDDILEEIKDKTEEEKKQIADEIKNKILSSI